MVAYRRVRHDSGLLQETRLAVHLHKGFFCDTSVPLERFEQCEAGAAATTPPSPQHDPLYITVPLGFDVPMNMQDCPASLVCVDHPGTIDLTRIESALKPLYPDLSDAQLTEALANFAVPGHDHFITNLNHHKAEWWDVKIIGVTSPKTLHDIRAHKSLSHPAPARQEDKNVVGPVDNMFLFFAPIGPSTGAGRFSRPSRRTIAPFTAADGRGRWRPRRGASDVDRAAVRGGDNGRWRNEPGAAGGRWQAASAQNCSNTCARSWSLSPGPWSATSMTASSGRLTTETRTGVPSGVCVNAFVSRLAST
jgi:hypothetical protein